MPAREKCGTARACWPCCCWPTRAAAIRNPRSRTRSSQACAFSTTASTAAVTPRCPGCSQFGELAAPERVELLEKFLADSLSSFSLQEAAATNLKKYDQSLILRYRFVSEGYAEKAGSLLFVRPRVLGRKRAEFPVDKERTHPVAFSSTSLQTDLVEIVLPEGYRVDELPPPVELTTDFAEYHSRTEVEDNVLRYQRRYEIKEVRVPAERLPELKRFFQQVAGDERSRAVLKLSAQ